MGNQQERLIWLAGFIDGEGYLGIKKVRRANPYSGYQLTARIVISNTSENALAFLEGILKENGVPYRIKYPRIEKHWKPAFQIEIECFKPVSKLLNLVRHYLVVKAQQADILLAFIERRQKACRAAQNSRYTATDIMSWQQIKELNKVPSETIRQNASA